MDINEIYLSANAIANKYLSGAISPEEFNRFAAIVSNDLFKTKVGIPEEYQPGLPLPRQAWQVSYKISDDVKHLIVETDISKNATNFFPYPGTYAAFSSMKYGYISSHCDSELTWTRVEVVTDGELSIRLESKLLPPTHRHPIGAYYNDGFKVFPTDITSIRLTYLRYPTTPNWNFTLVNDQPVYNPTGSVNFDFPVTLHSDIVIRICRYMGINLREEELLQAALQRQNSGT